MKKVLLLLSIFLGLVLSVSANSSPPLAPMSNDEQVSISIDQNLDAVFVEMNSEEMTAVSPSCLNQDFTMNPPSTIGRYLSSANFELGFVSIEEIASSPPDYRNNSNETSTGIAVTISSIPKTGSAYETVGNMIANVDAPLPYNVAGITTANTSTAALCANRGLSFNSLFNNVG